MNESIVPDPTWLRGFYKTAIIPKVAADIAPATGRVRWISFRYFGVACMKHEVVVTKEVVCDVHVRMLWRASNVKWCVRGVPYWIVWRRDWRVGGGSLDWDELLGCVIREYRPVMKEGPVPFRFRRVRCAKFPHVCPSVRSHGTTRLPLNGFLWNPVLECFSKICREKS
jgi:hypothetical protein